MPMGTSDVLRSSIQHTHERLADRLQAARGLGAPPGRTHQSQELLDLFLAATSKHLHAIDAVLLPAARKQVPDGGHLVHDYLRSAKDLEVVMAHVKAHEYGSVYESGYAWPGVWCDVRAAMWDQGRHEEVLADRLTSALDDPQLDRLTERLRNSELAAPSRPHPYTPHTGPFGLAARRVMHTVDRFWDAVEGRMVPEPARAPRKPPGLVTQYLLADPHFPSEPHLDEEEKHVL
jgi:hypothetical protein